MYLFFTDSRIEKIKDLAEELKRIIRNNLEVQNSNELDLEIFKEEFYIYPEIQTRAILDEDDEICVKLKRSEGIDSVQEDENMD